MLHYQTTVIEFLQSGRLPNSVCFLQQEDINDTRSSAHEKEENSQERLTMENCVRLALLIARFFVDSSTDEGLPSGSSIQLNNLYLDLEPHDVVEENFITSRQESREIIFVGIGNFSPAEINTPRSWQQQQDEDSQGTPIQILGRLLCSIFFQGRSTQLESLLSPCLISSAEVEANKDNSENAPPLCSISLTSIEAEDDLWYSQIFQKPRITSVTSFSQLVDTRILPISICRFLSDMIDGGPGGRVETPFICLRDIVQDLELMISRPAIFLHDSYSPHHKQKTPVFGSVCRGRTEEVQTLLEIANQMEQSDKGRGSTLSGMEAVFMSGVAGSGKSLLVQAVGATLQRLGWVIVKSKFERGKSYASGRIVSSMFDKVISHLVQVKDGGRQDDVAYCERATEYIRGSIGKASLSWLVGFLPSLSSLFVDGVDDSRDDTECAEMPSGFKLVHCLSIILKAVLEPGRFIMIVADDLQWADETSISLICKVLLSIADDKHVSRRCLFISMFRHDEINDGDPFATHYSLLRESHFVNATEIKLSGLSKNDITEIIMSELKLPRRMVADLAGAVYKKSAGHALYVTELLNSLMDNSIIAYSTQKHSFAWDPDRIEFIQMSENVAELIRSNLNLLSEKSLFRLQILSCFGIQTDVPLLQVLEKFEAGLLSSLDEFVDRGILDRAGPIVIFAHDLILQAVYESMSFSRRSLHLKIGRHLGASISLQDKQTFFAGSRVTSCLLSLACDQVNLAGNDFVGDEDRLVEFSAWNLEAGRRMIRDSDFAAALHYVENGILFLGEDSWKKDLRLFAGLHECAVVASFALGRTDETVQHADVLTDHVPFEETLQVQVVVLKSLSMVFRQEEGISRGFKILRLLGFSIPASPTEDMVTNAMSDTDKIAFQHNIDDIVDLCDKLSDKSEHSKVKVIGAFLNFFWEETSLLALLACESIKYSLQHGVCLESATAFAVYAMVKIRHEGDYFGGKWWADASRAIIRHYKDANKTADLAPALSVRNILGWAVDVWFTPVKELASKAIEFYDEATKAGLADDAISSSMGSWSYLLYGGQKLSILSQSSLSRFQEIAKYSQFYAKSIVCDYIYLMELTGEYKDYFSELDGAVCSLDDVQAEAESNNIHMVAYHIKVTNILRAYWKGDYLGAEESGSSNSMSNLDNTSPLFSILHCFFLGLVSFRLYRTLGNDERLSKGREMLIQMEKWANISKAVFGTKYLLLKAEHAASIGGRRDIVKKYYSDAIRTAQDQGNIHELALAHELLGNYYHATEGSAHDSSNCFERACVFYKQWGATAVVERIFHEHSLDIASVTNVELQMGKSKRLGEHED